MDTLICREHGFRKNFGDALSVQECMHCQFERGEIKKEDFLPFPKLFDGHLHGEDKSDFDFFETHNTHNDVALERKSPILDLAARRSNDVRRPDLEVSNINRGTFRPMYYLFYGIGFCVWVNSVGEPNKYCDKWGIPIKEKMDEFILDFFGIKYKETPQLLRGT